MTVTTERKAWFCPACHKYHAPHVETCPGPVDAIGTTLMPKYYPGRIIPMAPYDPCARKFVTDANTTTTLGIGTTVAAGGANKVPVYSDGTNWIIG